MKKILDSLEYCLGPYRNIFAVVILAVVLTVISTIAYHYQQHYSKSAIEMPTTATAYHFTNDELIFDSTTNIVYIRTSTSITPYFSENGNLCRYVDGKIIEVEAEQ